MSTLTFPIVEVLATDTYTLDISSPTQQGPSSGTMQGPNVGPISIGGITTGNSPKPMNTYQWMGLVSYVASGDYTSPSDSFTYPAGEIANWLPGYVSGSGFTLDQTYYALMAGIYYSSMQLSIDVQLIRTTNLSTFNFLENLPGGTDGVNVVDSLVITGWTAVFSDPIDFPMEDGVFGGDYNDARNAEFNQALTDDGLPENTFPTTLTFSSTTTSSNICGHAGPAIIWSGSPSAALFNNGYTINSVYPAVYVDLSNQITGYSVDPLTGSTDVETIQKMDGSVLSINGTIDPQSQPEPSGQAYHVGIYGPICLQSSSTVGEPSSPEIYVGPGTAYSTESPYPCNCFIGVEGTWDLAFTNLNVALGDLVCTAKTAGNLPTVPTLTVPASPSGPLHASVPCDTTNWGGFRYLNLTVTPENFSTTKPLPNTVIGIIPESLLTQTYYGGPFGYPQYSSPTLAGVLQAALNGDATIGIWYDLNVNAQGSQTIKLDLAKTVKGSGNWGKSVYGPITPGYFDGPGEWGFATQPLLDPLGVGIFSVNPMTPVPGNSNSAWAGYGNPPYSSYPTYPDPGYGQTLTPEWEPAVLVLVVDGGAAVVGPSGPATVTVSALSFVEEVGSSLEYSSLCCWDCQPVPAKYVKPQIEYSTPLSGSMLTLRRDGKVSSVINVVSAEQVNFINHGLAFTNPTGGIDFAVSPLILAGDYLTDNSGAQPIGIQSFTWSTLLEVLNWLGNGYSWSVNQTYTNYPDGTEMPFFLLPIDDTFNPGVFQIGQSINIPIGYKCLNYKNLIPWYSATISGVALQPLDKTAVGVTALSNFTQTWTGGALTIQSAKLVNGVPVLTSTYGPTTVTPDSTGFVYVNLGDTPVLVTDFAGNVEVTTAMPTPEVDGIMVSFDRGLARGNKANGTMASVYIPIRSGGYGTAYDNEPSPSANLAIVSRKTDVAFCVRSLGIAFPSLCAKVHDDGSYHLVAHSFDKIGQSTGLAYWRCDSGHPSSSSAWRLAQSPVITDPTSDFPCLAIRPDGRIIVVYDLLSSGGSTTKPLSPRVAVSYETHSDDSGATWSNPTEMNITKGQYPKVRVGADGSIYRAAYVDDGTGNNTGIIMGQFQSPGDAAPSTPYIFMKWNSSTNTWAPISVQQGTFDIDLERDGSVRWILTCIEVDQESPSEYCSADDAGGTWSPVSGTTGAVGGYTLNLNGGNATDSASIGFYGGGA